jgi:hypothetical protein
MIIGISGYAKTGKDTLGQVLVEKYGFERRAFADKLKEAALALNPIIFTGRVERLSSIVARMGWGEAKEFREVRQTLQRMGTEMGREAIDPDIWVTAMENTMRRTITGQVTKNYVVTDVRFMNEANWIIHRQHGKVLRIERPGVGPANDHISETGLDGYPFSGKIVNDGTIDDLFLKVEWYLARWNGPELLSSEPGQDGQANPTAALRRSST